MPTTSLSSVRFLLAWLLLLGGLIGWWLVRPWYDAIAWANLTLLTLFVTSKIATLLCMPPDEFRRLSVPGLVAYCLWPGMRPRVFVPATVADPNAPVPTFAGVGLNLLASCVLLWIVPRFLPAGTPELVRLWIGLVGYCFFVMFVLMDLWSLLYRWIGFPVEKLWVAPILAVSLNDFWGKRWNRVFSGMLREVLFQPLLRPLGVLGAAFCVYLYSGVLHENASFSAGRGYGGPTLYFLIQFTGVVVERLPRMRALVASPLPGWLWTLLVVIGPVALLISPAYLEVVIRPVLVDLGVPGILPTDLAGQLP